MKLWLKTLGIVFTLAFFGGIAGLILPLAILATALWLTGVIK